MWIKEVNCCKERLLKICGTEMMQKGVNSDISIVIGTKTNPEVIVVFGHSEGL